MADWCNDEYPWLNREDPWFGRPYIGDEFDPPTWSSVERNKLIATFYGSDDGDKEEKLDLSDISDESDDNDVCDQPSINIEKVLNKTMKRYSNKMCRMKLHHKLYSKDNKEG
jgi:hypothetical protein